MDTVKYIIHMYFLGILIPVMGFNSRVCILFINLSKSNVREFDILTPRGNITESNNIKKLCQSNNDFKRRGKRLQRDTQTH